MKRDLEIDLLRAFVAVAGHQSFTHAARETGRTQSAVSLQIKRLEDIVGKRLFERSRQSVTITHAGESLLVYAQRILAANDAALSHIQRPEAAGRIRLGAPDDYATMLLPPILSGITKENPRLQFEVTCDNAVDLLGRLDGDDLDLVVATHHTGAVTGQAARHESLHWVAAPTYVDDPDKDLSLVLFPAGCVCRDIALDALEQVDRGWRITYTTRSIGLMEQAMLETPSVSVMETSVIPPSLKIISGRPGFPALSEVVISVHQAKNRAPQVAWVAEALRRKLGQRPRG